MAEYIEREAAVKIAERYGLTRGSVLGRHTGIADCIASEIDQLPAADVAPVVRCKDCKYNRGGNKCLNPDSFFAVPADDDFCSYGERKDGGVK